MTEKTKKNKVGMNVTIDSDLKKELEIQADKEGRSLSSFVNHILSKALRIK